MRGEEGQSLVEFAILLPILVLLSFGTLDLSIFLYRQITLTGAGFLAARAATVGGVEGNNPLAGAREVVRAYGEDAAQPWIMEIADQNHGQVAVAPEAGRTMRVSVFRTDERWSGAAVAAVAALGGQLKPEVGRLGAAIAINREWVAGPGGKSAQQRRSSARIEYSIDLGPLSRVEQTMAPFANGIRSSLGSIPTVGTYANSVATVVSFSPLQAVGPNPDPTGVKTYHDGRSLASVYASSDNELVKDHPEFRQSGRLLEGLETGAQSTEAVCAALAALNQAPPDPLVTAALKAFKIATLRVAQLADGAVKPIEALNHVLFAGSGGTP